MPMKVLQQFTEPPLSMGPEPSKSHGFAKSTACWTLLQGLWFSKTSNFRAPNYPEQGCAAASVCWKTGTWNRLRIYGGHQWIVGLHLTFRAVSIHHEAILQRHQCTQATATEYHRLYHKHPSPPLLLLLLL